MDPNLPLAALTLVLEISGPRVTAPGRSRGRPGRGPLRLWRGMAPDAAAAPCIYLMPDNAVRLVHGDIDLCTEADMMRPGETVELRYVACRDGRHDIFAVTNFDQDRSESLRSGVAQSVSLAHGFPADPRYLNIAHIAAVAPERVGSADLPGIESGAIVETPQGPRPVDALCTGDLVLDVHGRALPLRWIEARPRLCLGRTAPVRLRAPYFGLARDLVATPRTQLMQAGPVVDYLYGSEAVLAQVGDLANGRAVFTDRRQPVRVFYHMMLDGPACILVERCPIATATFDDVVSSAQAPADAIVPPTDPVSSPCLPLLDRASARALLSEAYRVA